MPYAKANLVTERELSQFLKGLSCRRTTEGQNVGLRQGSKSLRPKPPLRKRGEGRLGWRADRCATVWNTQRAGGTATVSLATPRTRPFPPARPRSGRETGREGGAASAGRPRWPQIPSGLLVDAAWEARSRL